MADEVIYLTPTGKKTLEHDATNEVGAADVSLVSPSVIALSSDGTNVTNTVLGAPSASGLVLSTVFSKGTDGEDYRVTSHCEGNSSGKVSERIWEVRVRSAFGHGVK